MAWRRSKLTSLADFINGYAFKPSDWGKEGLPIIRIEQLKDPSKVVDFYSGNLPPANIIDNGDLVFSWSASLFLRIWMDGKAALNQHLFKVVEREGISRLFLKYLIEYYLPELTKAAHGSTMQHITRKELEAFEAEYPEDIDEQEGIERILLSVDQAITLTEALMAKQERIKTGMMQDLLTKGLDERGRIRTEETHEFKDTPIGRVPVEWTVEKLSNLTTAIVDGVHHTPRYTEFGVPFVTVRNLTKSRGIDFEDLNFVSKEDHEIFKKRAWPKSKDVLVTKDGTLGIARVVPEDCEEFSIFVSVALLRPNLDKVVPEFVALFFETPVFHRQLGALSAGTGLKHIHLEHFRQFQLRTPPIDEQHLIIDQIGLLNASLNQHLATLTKLCSLKRGLMHDLLTGKVRVPVLVEHKRQAVGAVA
jgi:type I restriction enzyme, S subunit